MYTYPCGREKFDENPRLPTSLYPKTRCISPACICMYLSWGEPLCDIIPLHTCGRFVSLADFCRLTRKHPWTLPPPFTFNLYQSIQPSQNRTKERTAPRIIHARQLLNPPLVLRALPSTTDATPFSHPLSQPKYFSQSSPTTHFNDSIRDTCHDRLHQTILFLKISYSTESTIGLTGLIEGKDLVESRVGKFLLRRVICACIDCTGNYESDVTA